MHLMGVDVGGTFTDVVYADTDANRTFTLKTPTTPDDPSVGVIEGASLLCRRHGVDPALISHFFHGTTIATNAVLEHDGAETGMITNRGFRDVLHIGRHQRPQNYSIMQDIPWQARPLIKRRNRHTVPGRLIPPDGSELEPLDEKQVRTAAQKLKKSGVDAVAVCFLFSYLSPDHEERAAEIVREEFPACFVTTSSSVAPQFREFERFTTAAMNAFIGPKVRDYVSNLVGRLDDADFKVKLHVMSSQGGVATAEMVSERPVITLLSGPAAGVLGGAWNAGQLKEPHNLVTFDVGGTSADIGIIIEGEYVESSARDTQIGGFPVLVPMIDITTIGAGGGSIAYVDEGNAFRVGPQSAGSRPGPAAYGQGGDKPTVSDANVVLGRLDPDNFLGGEMKLDADAAHGVIAALAREVGLPEVEAAEGVLTIVNNAMANAIRSRTIQKGHDPRNFRLVAFGGAGPLHGAEVADILQIPEVVIPPFPGNTSAEGLLTTDLRYERIKTAFQVSKTVDTQRLNVDFQELRDALETLFTDDGIETGKVKFSRSGDLRYVGQGYELRIDFPHGVLDEKKLTGVWQAFHDRHRAEYGHAFQESSVEIVNIRLAGTSAMPKIGHKKQATRAESHPDAIRHGQCHFRANGKLREFRTAYYRREDLSSGADFPGPAIVLHRDTTTVVPPQWCGRVLEDGVMLLRRNLRGEAF